MELEEQKNQVIEEQVHQNQNFQIDNIQYTFSPLLLFTKGGYHDKGYSNFNSVEEFFRSIIPINMLHNVIYEKKNITYDIIVEQAFKNRSLIICCICAHFTAVQILDDERAIVYDPTSKQLQFFKDKVSSTAIVIEKLIRCKYGDDSHLQNNPSYYKGQGANQLKVDIYQCDKQIAEKKKASVTSKETLPLALQDYIFFNDPSDPQNMSTQLTGNTCYFQIFLFAVLCKVGQISLDNQNKVLVLQNVDQLINTAQAMCQFLNQFFIDNNQNLRVLTNNNFIIDFFHFKHSSYFDKCDQFLFMHNLESRYEEQYQKVLNYQKHKKILQLLNICSHEEKMTLALNTKQIQFVTSPGEEGGDLVGYDFCMHNYYKFRPINLMDGISSKFLRYCDAFSKFLCVRKHSLLNYYPIIQAQLQNNPYQKEITKYKDYYFMPQYEVGQQELVDLHHYLYILDMYALDNNNQISENMINSVNQFLYNDLYFSTSEADTYEQLLSLDQFMLKNEDFQFYLKNFLTIQYFSKQISLGLQWDGTIDVNCMTRCFFYDLKFINQQKGVQSEDFFKQCINELASEQIPPYQRNMSGDQNINQIYSLNINIGDGYNYSPYNNFLHFFNTVDNYWENQELNFIQIFSKDIRNLLSFLSQKIIFSQNHNYYHYGPTRTKKQDALKTKSADGAAAGEDRESLVDENLVIGLNPKSCMPYISKIKKDNINQIQIYDKIYNYDFIKQILKGILDSKKNRKIKSKDIITNLCILNLLLDFGLFADYFQLLNVQTIFGEESQISDTKQLQIWVINQINELQKKYTHFLTRNSIEFILYSFSHKFFIPRDLNDTSQISKHLKSLNQDIKNFQYVILCKIYISLCQINKSAELDYYKIKCNHDYKIIIPEGFNISYGDFLHQITKKYYFYQQDHFICYDKMNIFNVKHERPFIQLYKLRVSSQKEIQSMFRYIILNNCILTYEQDKILFFINGNILKFQQASLQKNCSQQQQNQEVQITLQQQQNDSQFFTFNEIRVTFVVMHLNDTFSMIPCFKYQDSLDVFLLCSEHIYHHIDNSGQFNDNYYGAKQDLIEAIQIEIAELNSLDQFKSFRQNLKNLVKETKILFYAPHYFAQIEKPDDIISLIDYSIKIKNIALFIYSNTLLKRISLFVEYEKKYFIGPWAHAIQFLEGTVNDQHYNQIIQSQYIDIDQYEHYQLPNLIDALCEHFVKYQQIIDGKSQIIPTQKQKNFLETLITGQKSFYFSEVGSGKSKVIVPLYCQLFLSNNIAFHKLISKDQVFFQKSMLIIIVPEHLVNDAKKQLYRYCLNIQYRKDFKIYDNISIIKHEKFRHDHLNYQNNDANIKKIFICSFNQFKKALTDEDICKKIEAVKSHIQILIDEVDDFLDREKLVFNICRNKNHDLDDKTIESYYNISKLVYDEDKQQQLFSNYTNPGYWLQLFQKFKSLDEEIQYKSRSLNKNFGIFNELTLKHCLSNNQFDTQGYKSLIARPYESVNRAMPGSYYSDVERTIYLTYYILMEDTDKYNDLFQQERKYITFDYYNQFIKKIEYDDLIYGTSHLCTIIEQFPEIKVGLTKYLYQIILKQMEIQDKSRTVNSIDIIFNFDCKGFTGTPFIDNYPTYHYFKRAKLNDPIPDLIERSFYLHSSDPDLNSKYKEKFISFQGNNHNIIMQYRDSQFIQEMENEIEIFREILQLESCQNSDFNCIVDLAGIFKKIQINEIRDLIKEQFSNQKFQYIYHIDQVDGSDRILYLESDNEVPYDQEFYGTLCKNFGEKLSSKIFFFIDNRNVTGKDVPFQLIFQNHFNLPMIYKSVILAHDLNDFSKIWQAMGRSRTMNLTQFCIYKDNLEELLDLELLYSQSPQQQEQLEQQIEIEKTDINNNNNNTNFDNILSLKNMQTCPITKALYIDNCDKKVIGNLTSIYQTLVSLGNLTLKQFYHDNSIINTFILKLNKAIDLLVTKHVEGVNQNLSQNAMIMNMFKQILQDKFKVDQQLKSITLEAKDLLQISQHIILQKFEQRLPSNDILDKIIYYLQGEQKNNNYNELNYTKQQQQQKQQQKDKNQDNDIMQETSTKILFSIPVQDYYQYTQSQNNSFLHDEVKNYLNYPIFSNSICQISFQQNNQAQLITVYPTIQFLYSNFLEKHFITDQLKSQIESSYGKINLNQQFQSIHSEQLQTIQNLQKSIVHTHSKPYLQEEEEQKSQNLNSEVFFEINIFHNAIRQSAQFTLLYLGNGIFIIGMKNQFSKYDLNQFQINNSVQYISDESGQILYWADSNQKANKNKILESPYSLNLYILLEKLTKQELPRNVISYYHNHEQLVKESVQNYDEMKGSGFVCWRFIFDQIFIQLSLTKKKSSRHNPLLEKKLSSRK